MVDRGELFKAFKMMLNPYHIYYLDLSSNLLQTPMEEIPMETSTVAILTEETLMVILMEILMVVANTKIKVIPLLHPNTKVIWQVR